MFRRDTHQERSVVGRRRRRRRFLFLLSLSFSCSFRLQSFDFFSWFGFRFGRLLSLLIFPSLSFFSLRVYNQLGRNKAYFRVLPIEDLLYSSDFLGGFLF